MVVDQIQLDACAIDSVDKWWIFLGSRVIELLSEIMGQPISC